MSYLNSVGVKRLYLLDGALYDFKGARATGVADDNGDKAFDAEEFPVPSALPGVQVVHIQ